MLHLHKISQAPIHIRQINFSNKPNAITMGELFQKNVRYIKKQQIFEQDMEIVRQDKLKKKIDHVLDVKLNVELGVAEQELLHQRQEERMKSKLFAPIIFKYRFHPIFKNAGHLHYVYMKYKQDMINKEKKAKKQQELIKL